MTAAASGLLLLLPAAPCLIGCAAMEGQAQQRTARIDLHQHQQQQGLGSIGQQQGLGFTGQQQQQQQEDAL